MLYAEGIQVKRKCLRILTLPVSIMSFSVGIDFTTSKLSSVFNELLKTKEDKEEDTEVRFDGCTFTFFDNFLF